MRACENALCNNTLDPQTQRYNKCCSKKCMGEHRKNVLIDSWISGEWNATDKRGELSETISHFLKEQADYKCSQCGWGEVNPASGKVPVQIDHIDGDSTNNRPENLRVLCPNCHSITPTYGSLNANGRGRRGWRRQYDALSLKPILATKNKTETCSCGESKENINEYCVECFLDPNRRVKRVSTCKCGNNKSQNAKTCFECRKQSGHTITNYPPIEEIIEGVLSSNMRAYAATLGKSDNAVRKHLIRNNVPEEEYTKPLKTAFCHCGNRISDEDRVSGLSTCVDHRAKYTDYPPLDDIAQGIKEHGFSNYAKSLGLAYPSSLRRHLERRGVNWRDLIK